MNDVLDCLLTRRSIKKYTTQPVEREKLEQIVQAGTYAANGSGIQSPIIIAVTAPAVRNELAQLNAAVIKAQTDPFYGAPVVLCVLADRSCSTRVNDGSLVIGNMLAAAHSLGLGSCWIHRAKEVFDTERGRELLAQWGLTGDYEGVGFCIIGYPDGQPPQAKARKDHYVTWVE